MKKIVAAFFWMVFLCQSLQVEARVGQGQSNSASAASTASNTSTTVSGNNGYTVTLTGKLAFESPAGTNTHQKTYLFSGLGFANFFQTPVTTFDSFNASQMFLVSSSKFGITASRQTSDWKQSLVGVLNFNQAAGAKTNTSEAYLLFENDLFGSLALGNTYGAEECYAVGPFDLTAGSGGVTGTSILNFIPLTTGVPIYNAMVGYTSTATKIRYESPRTGGIMAFVSFTPNTIHRGDAPLNTGVSPARAPFQPFDLNSVAYGANYLAQWDKGSFGLSFVGLVGSTQPEKPLFAAAETVEIVSASDPQKIITKGKTALTGNELVRFNTNAYQVGGVFALGSISLAAEWIFNGNSHQLSNNFNPIINVKTDDGIDLAAKQGIIPPMLTVNGQQETFVPKQYVAAQAGDGKMLTLGLGYTAEEYRLSLSYINSSVKTGFLSEGQTTSNRATGTGYMLSAEYNVVPGLTPYFEIGQFNFINPDWAYTATMIPTLTQFEYCAVPGYETPSIVVMLGIKIQF